MATLCTSCLLCEIFVEEIVLLSWRLLLEFSIKKKNMHIADEKKVLEFKAKAPISIFLDDERADYKPGCSVLEVFFNEPVTVRFSVSYSIKVFKWVLIQKEWLYKFETIDYNTYVTLILYRILFLLGNLFPNELQRIKFSNRICSSVSLLESVAYRKFRFNVMNFILYATNICIHVYII